MRPSPKTILVAVSTVFNLDYDDLVGSDENIELNQARCVYCMVASSYNHSAIAIARVINKGIPDFSRYMSLTRGWPDFWSWLKRVERDLKSMSYDHSVKSRKNRKLKVSPISSYTHYEENRIKMAKAVAEHFMESYGHGQEVVQCYEYFKGRSFID